MVSSKQCVLGKMRTNCSYFLAQDWLFNYVVVQSTPVGIHHLQWGLYLIYAVLNAVFVPLVYYLVVETRGRSLEEIDRWFENNKKWIVHKADHSVGGEMLAMNGGGLPKLHVADDHEAMMRAFEVAADSDDEGSLDGDRPVGRKSYSRDE